MLSLTIFLFLPALCLSQSTCDVTPWVPIQRGFSIAVATIYSNETEGSLTPFRRAAAPVLEEFCSPYWQEAGFWISAEDTCVVRTMCSYWQNMQQRRCLLNALGTIARSELREYFNAEQRGDSLSYIEPGSSEGDSSSSSSSSSTTTARRGRRNVHERKEMHLNAKLQRLFQSSSRGTKKSGRKATDLGSFSQRSSLKKNSLHAAKTFGRHSKDIKNLGYKIRNHLKKDKEQKSKSATADVRADSSVDDPSTAALLIKQLLANPPTSKGVHLRANEGMGESTTSTYENSTSCPQAFDIESLKQYVEMFLNHGNMTQMENNNDGMSSFEDLFPELFKLIQLIMRLSEYRGEIRPNLADYMSADEVGIVFALVQLHRVDAFNLHINATREDMMMLQDAMMSVRAFNLREALSSDDMDSADYLLSCGNRCYKNILSDFATCYPYDSPQQESLSRAFRLCSDDCLPSVGSLLTFGRDDGATCPIPRTDALGMMADRLSRKSEDGFSTDCINCCNRASLDSLTDMPKQCIKSIFEDVYRWDWPEDDGRAVVEKPSGSNALDSPGTLLGVDLDYAMQFPQYTAFRCEAINLLQRADLCKHSEECFLLAEREISVINRDSQYVMDDSLGPPMCTPALREALNNITSSRNFGSKTCCAATIHSYFAQRYGNKIVECSDIFSSGDMASAVGSSTQSDPAATMSNPTGEYGVVVTSCGVSSPSGPICQVTPNSKYVHDNSSVCWWKKMVLLSTEVEGPFPPELQHILDEDIMRDYSLDPVEDSGGVLASLFFQLTSIENQAKFPINTELGQSFPFGGDSSGEDPSSGGDNSFDPFSNPDGTLVQFDRRILATAERLARVQMGYRRRNLTEAIQYGIQAASPYVLDIYPSGPNTAQIHFLFVETNSSPEYSSVVPTLAQNWMSRLAPGFSSKANVKLNAAWIGALIERPARPAPFEMSALYALAGDEVHRLKTKADTSYLNLPTTSNITRSVAFAPRIPNCFGEDAMPFDAVPGQTMQFPPSEAPPNGTFCVAYARISWAYELASKRPFIAVTTANRQIAPPAHVSGGLYVAWGRLPTQASFDQKVDGGSNPIFLELSAPSPPMSPWSGQDAYVAIIVGGAARNVSAFFSFGMVAETSLDMPLTLPTVSSYPMFAIVQVTGADSMHDRRTLSIRSSRGPMNLAIASSPQAAFLTERWWMPGDDAQIGGIQTASSFMLRANLSAANERRYFAIFDATWTAGPDDEGIVAPWPMRAAGIPPVDDPLGLQDNGSRLPVSWIVKVEVEPTMAPDESCNAQPLDPWAPQMQIGNNLM